MRKGHILLFVVALVGFWFYQSERAPHDDDNILNVIAGPELKDLQPYLEEIRRATGVTLRLNYTGTIAGAESIAAGNHGYDAGWFSHAKYLLSLQAANGKRFVRDFESIMLSPVILGVKESVGLRLGWCYRDPNWEQIATAAANGAFRYAKTNATSSNTGFSVDVAVQVARHGLSLDETNVDSDYMRGFAKGHVLRSGDSGWLAEKYIERQRDVDGIFSYESALINMNDDPRLVEKLCLIYPREGTITADYPLLLLNERKRRSWRKVVDFLRTPRFQEKLVAMGNRPVVAGVLLDKRFPADKLALELPFPTKLSLVNAILTTYLNKQLARGHVIMLGHISGSVGEKPMEDLRSALDGLTGTDTSITGQFARYRNGELITYIPFDEHARAPRTFTFKMGNTAQRNEIRSHILANFQLPGDTAIFSALRDAYRFAVGARRNNPERPVSIVLLSDERSTKGLSEEDFRNEYQRHHDLLARIPTFTVVYGQADESQMNRIAELTGGRAFDGRKHPLTHVFKKIRGYQ